MLSKDPGLAYVAEKYQLAAEAVVPLNAHTRKNVGLRMQLLLFTDDLVPGLFGRPLLSH
jgi:hypothetical protein